jgi:hypothetical protein
LVAGLIVLGVGGFIAWIATRPETGESQAAECVLVVDRTASSENDVSLQRRRDAAARAVTGCRELKARMSIYYFSQQDQKLVLMPNSEDPSQASFELWLQKGRKKSVQESKLDDVVEAAQAAALEVFSKPNGTARGSDILAAIDGAADNLSTEARADGVGERHLIILTDGIQVSDGVTVEALAEQSSPVEPLLESVRSLNLVPMSLEGAQVNFIGVKSGQTESGEQLPQWFDSKVEEFWRNLVDQAGGRMCKYEPDSTSIPVSC